MLRIAAKLCAFILACAFLLPASATARDWSAIEAMLAPYDDPQSPGVSVAISIDGELAFEGWAGRADIAQGVDIGSDTRFEIASISKQFTAFAIMLLVKEGKLSLDQQVGEIIPEFTGPAGPVTIRHLLSHTGGLREVNSLLGLTGQSDASPITQARALDLILRQHGANFAPGARYEYSNTGYQLLAEIVARVSGQPFAEFMQTRIFAPLGMEDTQVRTDPDAIIARLAQGYRPTANGFARVHLVAATFGSTGIVSTPRDLLRWARVFETGQVGGEAVLQRMAARSTLADGTAAVAANGQEFRKFRGFDTWSHGGTTGGFRSFLLRIPEARMNIVVMSNRADLLKAAFAFDIAEVLLGDRLEPKQESAVEPTGGTALDRYVGDYRLFAGIVFSIRRDGDRLTFSRFGSDDASPLPEIERGVFLLDADRQLRLVFRDFANGKASQMRWQISEDGFIPAPRVEMLPVPAAPLHYGDLAGNYYSPTLQQVVSLMEDAGRLWLRAGNGDRAQLELYQPDTFRTAEGGDILRVKLVRDEDGSVAGLLVSAALADDIAFRRIPD